jgi:hypothetical protein
MDRHLLILFLHLGGLAAALAHVGPHCVTGIALPPVDATVFVSVVALAAAREHKGRIPGVCSGAEVVFPDNALRQSRPTWLRRSASQLPPTPTITKMVSG